MKYIKLLFIFFCLGIFCCSNEQQNHFLYGSWIGNFGSLFRITNGTFSSFTPASMFFSSFYFANSIVDINESTKTLILYVDEKAIFNLNSYSKVVFTSVQDDSQDYRDGYRFYICTIANNISSLQETLDDTTVADSSNPSEEGCGGFAWTKLKRELELSGTWDITDSDEVLNISLEMFHSATKSSYSNIDRYLIYSNSLSSTYDKIVWTEIDESNSTYYCTIASGLSSLKEAMADTTVANSSNPSAGGCKGSSWTSIVRRLDIVGNWENTVDTNVRTVEISSSSWNPLFETARSEIVSYQSLEQTLIFRVFDPASLGKLAWIIEINAAGNQNLYYCVFAEGRNQKSAESVVDVTDFSSPSTRGCLGNPWLLAGERQ